MRYSLKTGLLVWLGISCLSFSSPALAQHTYVRVHVRPEPLANGLMDFAIQAGLSVNETGIDFRNAVNNAVNGTFTQEDALRRLLSGTGYDFQFVSEDTVQIRVAKRMFVPGLHPSVMENVLVTATKHPEIAQSLPYSIAVTQGSDLQTLGVRSSNGLTTFIAGLTATNLGAGENKLFVRGLTDSVLPGLSESVVGLYLDETRIADDAPDPYLQLVDIDRVEVLRGPQGSLYGAGSLAGLVRIITNKPVFDQFESMLGVSGATTLGGGLSSNLQGMVNLPLVTGRLALRLVGYMSGTAGYVDDLRLHISDTNRTDIRGGRALLSWKPKANWTVTGNVNFQSTSAKDSQYYLERLGAYDRDNYLREPHDDRTLLAGVTAQADFGSFDLVSNTSVLDRWLKTQFDASKAWPSLTGFPLGPSPFVFSRTILSFTHETRLSSDSRGRWEWLTGLFMAFRDEDFDSNLTGPNASGTDVLARSEFREDRNSEAALFGELTYHFTRNFSLIAGARVFYADHWVTARRSGLLVNSILPFKGTSRQTGIAPKFVLDYQPSSNTTLYAQYSEGYRLGGINVDGPPGATEEAGNVFDSDELHNYEVGAKLRLFRGFVIANMAAYIATWDNVQTDQIAPDGAFFILNAGTVRDLGVELDLGMQPLENLNLQAHTFWNNASFVHPNPILVAAESGLPGAPDVSVGLSARYDIPLGRVGTAFFQTSFDYVGASHLGFGENTPAMGNYRLANLRVGWLRGHWEMVLYADNLLDDVRNTFAFGNPFDLNTERQITPPQPRTMGISLVWTR